MQQYSPAAERNQSAILGVLRPLLAATGTVLEVASGSGQHIVAFAAAAPGLTWIPGDRDPAARASIAARTAAAGLANVAAPLAIDVTSAGWQEALDRGCAGIVAINLLHVAPWAACAGLMAGAAALLEEGAWLYFYGPFMRERRHTAASNAAFHKLLRSRHPDWGLRDVGEVAAVAGDHGLGLDRLIEMPVNNLSLIFRRGAT